MARIEVILQEDQRHLQEAVMQLSNDAQHMMPKNLEKCMRISLPATVDTQRLDDLGVEYIRHDRRKHGPYVKPGPAKVQSGPKLELHLKFSDDRKTFIEKNAPYGYQAFFNEMIDRLMQENEISEDLKTGPKTP